MWDAPGLSVSIWIWTEGLWARLGHHVLWAWLAAFLFFLYWCALTCPTAFIHRLLLLFSLSEHLGFILCFSVVYFLFPYFVQWLKLVKDYDFVGNLLLTLRNHCRSLAQEQHRLLFFCGKLVFGCFYNIRCGSDWECKLVHLLLYFFDLAIKLADTIDLFEARGIH